MPGAEALDLSYHMHDKTVAASFAPGDTTGRYLSHESPDSYGGDAVAVTRKAGGYYLTELTLEIRRLHVLDVRSAYAWPRGTSDRVLPARTTL